MWPFSKKEQTQVREVKTVLGQNDSLANFLIFGSKGGETPASALRLYRESSAVSIPINKVADAFSGIEPVLEIDGEIIRDHPILDLLRNPSPYYTQGLFLEALAKDYLVTNETHIVALGSINRPPLQLQPISPSNASITEGKGGTPGSIIISGTTTTGTYTPDTRKNLVRYFKGAYNELYYIRGYSTCHNSLLRGESLLVPASSEARQHILGGRHNVSLLEKGGRVSMVFHFEEDMKSEDLQATKDALNLAYAGADSAGAIGATSGGKMSVSELSKNNRDMDFAQLQQMAKFAVALQYKVPLPLVSIDAQSYSNYREANLALYDDAVLPLSRRIFGGLSAFLMPRYGLDPAKARIVADIDDISALALRRNEELKLRKELGIESDNEMRSMIGREGYVGGDLIYKPANMLPVGSDSYTSDNTIIPQVVRDGKNNHNNRR